MKKFYVLLLLFSLKIMAQIPELDNTFNVKDTGIYQQNIGSGGVVLANNKILSVYTAPGYKNNVLLLNPDGSPDKTFNTTDSFISSDTRIFAKSDGAFLTLEYSGKLKAFNADGTLNSGFAISTLKTTSTSPMMIRDIIYQDDGKAIIYGRFQMLNDDYTGGCIRLNPDGSLDRTFNLDSGGIKMVVQSDGKYVVAGSGRIWRFLVNGEIDPTFNVNTTIDPLQKFVTNGFETENNSSINDIIIQPDGKIIAVGTNFIENGRTISYYIVRLNANGTRDTSFKSLDSRSSNVDKVYLQKDNKIILNLGSNTFIRLNTDGTIDTTFKYSNTVSLINKGALYFQGDKIIINADYKDSQGITRSEIHRINTDGSLDLTFNPHSGPNLFFDEWDSFNQYDFVSKVLLDQKILLVGDFTTYNDNAARSICRINQNGEYDPTFKLDPIVKILTKISQRAYTIRQQNDGKIILIHNGGIIVNGSTRSIIRLNNDGSIDNSFNFNPYSNSESVTDIKILRNGKFLIIGSRGFFENKAGDDYSYNVIQLNSDGSIDTSYKAVFHHKPVSIFTLSNNKILISFMKDNYAYTYYPVLKLNEDGSTDSSFKASYQPYGHVIELNDGKLLITFYGQYYFDRFIGDTHLTRINSDGSSDPSFTPYSFFRSKVNRFDIYENGEINLFLSTYSTNTTNKLTLSSEGKLLNTTVYTTASNFEIQNCEDLLFYDYFDKIGDATKHNIVRYKTSNLVSNPNPLGEIYQPFTKGQTLGDLKVFGNNLKWYNIQSNCGINNKLTKRGNDETFLPSSTPIVDGMTYYASQTINGIESSYRLPVKVYEGLPVGNAGSDVTINCTTPSTTLLATGGVSYSWSPATGLSATNIANPVATPPATTTYTVTVTEANGGIKTDDVIITVDKGLPVATVGTDVTINCTTPSTTLSVTGGVSYSWSPATGLNATNIANPVATPIATTTYTVTVTGANGCTKTDDVVVTVDKGLTVATAGTDVTINCTTPSTSLSATGGVSYSWSPATGLNATNIANPVASPAATTTYMVTVTGANGCTKTDDVIVTVDKGLPVVNAGTDLTINGTTPSTTLSATGGVSYSWSPATGLSATNIAYPVATPAATTTYTVTVTGINGCIKTDDVIVTVYSSILGLKENDFSNLVAYPNPIKDYYTISNNEEINKVEVYNSLGQLLFSNKYDTSSIKIDFSSLNSGLYFVKIYSENKTATMKTIKN
jgi:uncharacterized delta-60 repeat protein